MVRSFPFAPTVPGAATTVVGLAPIAVDGTAAGTGLPCNAEYAGVVAGVARATSGAPWIKVHSTAYATTKPAETPMRALVSAGSDDGGPSCERSHPHCSHSFAESFSGAPQKLQCFFTFVSCTCRLPDAFRW